MKVVPNMSNQFRLNYHLMPPTGWMNDPNGLVKIGNTYHIYYQYSPDTPKGGLKHWGHYTTEDFINYIDHGIAASPDQSFDKDGMYSGSAYKNAEEDYYFFYTGNVLHRGDYDYDHEGREQNTVVMKSPDGFNFSEKQVVLRNEDYGENLSNHVRDPKILKEDDTYYIVLGARTSDDVGCVLLFESKNLMDWEFIHRYQTEEKFGYMWECPDLIKLGEEFYLVCCPQGVEQDGYKYQAIYQNGYFKIGKSLFEKEYLTDFIELDYGHDYYAPQSFQDGERTIQIAWMGLPDISYTNPTIADDWQHALTLPREISAKDGQIYQTPIDEMKRLRKNELYMALTKEKKFNCVSDTCEVHISELNGDFILQFGSLHMEYNNQLLTIQLENGYGRPEKHIEIENIDEMILFNDTSSIELFINNGAKTFTTRVYDEENPIITCNQKINITYYDLHPFEINQ